MGPVVDLFLTDDFTVYGITADGWSLEDRHEGINHSEGSYVPGDVHVNTVESAFSLLKRGIIAAWHPVSAKYFAAYIDEISFRFNNRNSPYLFRNTLMRLLNSANLEYKKLTGVAYQFVAASLCVLAKIFPRRILEDRLDVKRPKETSSRPHIHSSVV